MVELRVKLLDPKDSDSEDRLRLLGVRASGIDPSDGGRALNGVKGGKETSRIDACVGDGGTVLSL